MIDVRLFFNSFSIWSFVLIFVLLIEPNIIYLMADDMGYNDIGYNNEHVHSPIMDGLAKDGVTLKQNYVQTMCTPSRISFLSGMYPYHVGRQESKWTFVEFFYYIF